MPQPLPADCNDWDGPGAVTTCSGAGNCDYNGSTCNKFTADMWAPSQAKYWTYCNPKQSARK